jgi:hypothetical protein
MVIEKAKRLVEHKKDVVILLDSITRLARAYNTIVPPSGKVLSGGVDSNALQRPKRFFGAARNIEEGGSLTIISTALIDTGSRMDEVIFEEFKGTGNLENPPRSQAHRPPRLPVDRHHQERDAKGRAPHPEGDLNRVWVLRKVLTPLSAVEAMELLLSRMAKTKTEPGLPVIDVQRQELGIRGPGLGIRSARSLQRVPAELCKEGHPMLFLVFLLLILWFLGFMTSYTLGGVLHILLVVAIVLFLVHLIQGSSIGEA